jgi:hypothetical protein
MNDWRNQNGDSTMNLQMTHGTATFDFSTLPEQSVRAMLSRGLTHVRGSELASKVGPNSSWASKFEKDNKRKPTDEEVTVQRAIALAVMDAALRDGTVGTARGPKVDPVEAEMDKIAETKVWNILRATKDENGNVLATGKSKPKGEQEYVLGGTKYTFDDLVERQLTKFSADIQAEAEKAIAARKKAAESAQAKAAKLAENATAALGL